MNFTPQETKMIERLRKQDRQWRWARWAMLALGIGSAGMCALFGYLLHALIASPQSAQYDARIVFFIVLIWTKCCFYFLFSVWCFITTCLKWHGDVKRMLLLRLLDAQQNASSEQR